ncbi:TetR/AcrR family transcriptional regulator [Planomonospora sp. ID91781]|uniref:TetR/AcrR family transcriptional regulator n=1 Tax=Planomonospora sp. ID91781 TaxID=2738135 RepID=UPI001E4E12CF|nr:TetR/AcrR family transcriptional regulator [Planomonospora sp. ID91781]
MTEKAAPTTSRQIGRGQKVRSAVLAATLAQLGEDGYAALTVDNVAQRAGVNKTTVYRRWKDRESLVVDAITDRIAVDVPMPDTGSIHSDLGRLARSLVATLTSATGQAIIGTMLVGAAHVPEIAEIRRRFFADRISRTEPVIRRAVQRGELPEDTDPAELVKTLIAPIYLRLLVTAEPLDEAVADRAARSAIAAARAGALSGPRL